MLKPDTNNVEFLLSNLKDNFLAEIPDRCNDMEELILALEKEVSFTDSFNELFRAIHSLKGSGATMGAPIITSISHQFEDLLSEIDGDKTCLTTNSIDTMLKYNDLLKTSAQQLSQKTLDADRIHNELEKLKLSGRQANFSCMFVDQSSMLSRVVTKEFQGSPIKLTIINNGMVALERLLTEKIDVLVTSKELPVLNGVALISALRNSETKNAKIPCIITTSKDTPLSIESLNVTSVIKKDKLLAKNLRDNINSIIN